MSLRFGYRRLKTDGSKMNRFACLFNQAKWKKKCAAQAEPAEPRTDGLALSDKHKDLRHI